MKLLKKSKKTAVFLSYLSILIQAISTLILTSFYLSKLGADLFGLYQMVYAVAQYILILDLGISTVMIRYISEYDALNDREQAENFAFHFLIILSLISFLIILVGFIIDFNLEIIYSKLTMEESVLAHKLFRTMIAQLVFTVISRYLNGICEAFEQFVFTRSISICQIVLNTFLVFLLLKCNMGIIGIALANTIVIILNILVTIFYSVRCLNFKIKFHSWNFSMMKPVTILMIALLLQSIVGHVNGSLDKTILGIMTTKTDVAVYSVAATVITMFNTLPTVISNLFQPKATRLVVGKANMETLTDFVIKPGRIQFMIIGGFLAGFFILGRDFIECWVGREMLAAWGIVLLILVPNSVPLMQNVCLSILNALDKRIYRSLMLVGMTAFNVVFTIFLIKKIGPIGAPIATGVSYIIGHCIIMNYYYKCKIGFDIKRMFFGIMKGTWICVLMVLAISCPLLTWKCNGLWIVLIAKAIIFCFIYTILLLCFGLNRREKKLIYDLKYEITNKLMKLS